MGQALGQETAISNVESVSGGCINECSVTETTDGQLFFLKSNRTATADLFVREADGLEALSGTAAIRVPNVIVVGEHRNCQFLVLEFIKTGERSSHFFERMGQQLAELHQSTSCFFGFERDNYIGRTAQPNPKTKCWADFWVGNRLEHQFKLARSNGLANERFNQLADKVVCRVRGWFLEINEPPALIHGDLWSGNYLADHHGEPVFVDPAAYYAHREAEFGMTTLFGGFDQTFYDAYNEIWPLPDGSSDRIAIYRLYHLLNHLNLFGTSYLPDCLKIMNEYS